MLTVCESPSFARDARRIWTEDEVSGLVLHLATNPAAGDLIPGSGGLRKLRWGSGSTGKRGGARVVYYFFRPTAPLFLLYAYAKGAKVDLTADDLAAGRAFVEAVKTRYR